MHGSDRVMVYVVVAPSGEVFCRDVVALSTEDALLQCTNTGNLPQSIRQDRVERMKEEGWQVFSKLKWDYLEAEKEGK